VFIKGIFFEENRAKFSSKQGYSSMLKVLIMAEHNTNYSHKWCIFMVKTSLIRPLFMSLMVLFIVHNDVILMSKQGYLLS
jgi:hypothetical protein